MGVFGTVEIMIHCESEELANQIGENLEENVCKHIEKTFAEGSYHFGIDDMDVSGETIIVNISSNRVQNAEWQGEMIRDFIVENHKDDVYEISGEVTTPDNYLWWNKEEENNG